MDADEQARAAGPVLCPEIVGRQAERALIAGALARVREGRGGFVVLTGEPGIGKTRLARDAVARAGTMNVPSLQGRASAGTQAVPFRALAEALHAAFRSGSPPGPAVPDPYRSALGALIPEWATELATDLMPVVIFEAFVRLLGGLAREKGLLVVLEDLHWADADTLAALDYAADHFEREGVLCIATMRDEEGASLNVMETIAARRVATRLSLGRLSFDETADVARLSLGVRVLPRALMEALAARTEGVPFVIEEMLTAYVHSQDVDTLPHSYRELVRARLESLSENARETLHAAAILGRRFEWSLLAAVTRSEHDRVLSDLRLALDAKLIVTDAGSGSDAPFGFRHALVREVLLANLLPPQRADLSKRAADAIEADHPGLPGDWCERTAALREAAGEPVAAARHLQDAARRAVARGALGSAETMLERARSLVADDSWHVVGIDRLLVEVLSLEGKVERLQEIGSSALAWVHKKRTRLVFIILPLVDLHLRLAHGVAIGGDLDAAGLHLERAREVLADSDDTRMRMRLELAEAQYQLARGDMDACAEHAQIASAMAKDAGYADGLAEGLGIQARVAFTKGDTPRALELFHRALDVAPDPSPVRLNAMLEMGVVEAATSGSTDVLFEARELAERSGAIAAHARANLMIGLRHVERFELEHAAEYLESCIDTCRRYRLAALSDALAAEGERLALLGQTTEAQSVIANAGPAPRARAVLALLEEDHTAAAQIDPDADPVVKALVSLLSGGSAPPAGGGTLPAGLAGIANLATSSDPKRRFGAADADLAPYPWWRHIARRVIAERAIESGWLDPGWLRECLSFFDASGHARVASACRALLRRAGAPVPRKGRGEAGVPVSLVGRGVTSREMDVLRLVGEGMGNKEIAGRMFLSARTIETHVASLQRKLGAESRDQLRQAALQLREED